MSDHPLHLPAPSVYVTGRSKDGKSIVLPPKPLSWTVQDNGNLSLANVYVTNETPVDFKNRRGMFVYKYLKSVVYRIFLF